MASALTNQERSVGRGKKLVLSHKSNQKSNIRECCSAPSVFLSFDVKQVLQCTIDRPISCRNEIQSYQTQETYFQSWNVNDGDFEANLYTTHISKTPGYIIRLLMRTMHYATDATSKFT